MIWATVISQSLTDELLSCVIYPHIIVLFDNKDKWSTDKCYNMGESSKYSEWKKPDTVGHIVYGFIYINSSNQFFAC